MSPRPWAFLKSKTNREVVSWLGGGATVIAAGIWTVFVFLHQGGKSSDTATTPQVTQSGTGIASGGNTVINAPVNIGLDEKKTARQITEAQKPLEDRLERLASEVARQKGVEIPPLRAILVKLGEAGVGDEEIANRLDDKADELVKLRQEIAKLRQGPAELAAFAQQAQALIDKGDLDEARATLAAARAAARTLREQATRYETAFLVQEAKVDHLQLAYLRAAAKYGEAAQLIAAIDRQIQWEYVLGQARELYSQGHEFGDNGALAEALTVYRAALVLAPRSERPLDWAKTQNQFGVALSALGQRESGSTHLEEAITAFGNALQERARERAPLEWIDTQVSLGNAFARLGERESGTARLEQAVAAYRNALDEIARQQAPHLRTRTQYDLAIALRLLGARERDVTRLKDAVVNFRAVLKESDRKRAPLQWAATLSALGSALRTLGEHENDPARLEEAVANYREALKERTRERLPLEWARTQNNLGATLQWLGERENGTARLEEASIAYGEALKERARERVPLEWARTTGHRGVVLLLLADRRSDLETAQAALAQIEIAFVALRDGGDAASTERFERQLRRARTLVARLKKT